MKIGKVIKSTSITTVRNTVIVIMQEFASATNPNFRQVLRKCFLGLGLKKPTKSGWGHMGQFGYCGKGY